MLDIEPIKKREQAATQGHWVETWNDLPWTSDYQISDYGNVRSRLKKGNHKNKVAQEWRVLKQCIRKDGRKTVSIVNTNGCYQHFQVSKLVMLAFIGPRPEGMEIAHLNGDCADNRLLNLIYCTHKENESHKKLHGTEPKGENNGQAILQGWQVEEIKYLASKSIAQGKIAALFDISHKLVSSILNGNAWTHLESRTDIPALLDELERTRAAAKELRDWIKTLTSYLKMDSPEKPLVLSDITEVVQETKWLEELG